MEYNSDAANAAEVYDSNPAATPASSSTIRQIRRTAQAYAAEVGATLRTGALDAPAGTRALSPTGFGPSDAGRAWVLCSPNGATCSRLASDSAHVFAGALRNRTAVARAAAACADAEGRALSVIACGEVWTGAQPGENTLRPALEDALGAGAILAAAGGRPSPEAQGAIALWDGCAARVDTLIAQCGSGRELIERGHEADVRFASVVDADAIAPRLRDGAYAPVDAQQRPDVR